MKNCCLISEKQGTHLIACVKHGCNSYTFYYLSNFNNKLVFFIGLKPLKGSLKSKRDDLGAIASANAIRNWLANFEEAIWVFGCWYQNTLG